MDRGLTLLHFEFLILYCLIKIEAFCTKIEDFDRLYLNGGSKTQSVENSSLNLIFYDNFQQNIKSFSKQNSKLILHSKPDRNQSKLTVCNGKGYENEDGEDSLLDYCGQKV